MFVWIWMQVFSKWTNLTQIEFELGTLIPFSIPTELAPQVHQPIRYIRHLLNSYIFHPMYIYYIQLDNLCFTYMKRATILCSNIISPAVIQTCTDKIYMCVNTRLYSYSLSSECVFWYNNIISVSVETDIVTFVYTCKEWRLCLVYFSAIVLLSTSRLNMKWHVVKMTCRRTIFCLTANNLYLRGSNR